jgi:hypothetical protein
VHRTSDNRAMTHKRSRPGKKTRARIARKRAQRAVAGLRLEYSVVTLDYDPADPESFRKRFDELMQPTHEEWDEMEDKRLVEMGIDPDMDPIDLMCLLLDRGEQAEAEDEAGDGLHPSSIGDDED